MRFIGIDLISAVGQKVGNMLSRMVTMFEKHGMEMAATFAKVGVVATGIGVGLLGVAGGLAAAGVMMAKTAGDFQQQMTLLVTQAGATTAEMHDMTKAVLDLAPAVGFGPTQLAQALFHVESLGFRGAAALDMLKIAAEGAQVGNANLEDTVNALGGILATHINGVHNAADAMGQLNAIVGAGNMRMGDLVGAISTGVVPAAQTFGLSLKDVGGALATLTDLGTPAEEAATRLRMTFALMGAPTGAATKELKKIGLTSLELAMAMRGPGGLVAAVELLKSHLAHAFDLKTGKGQAEAADVLARAFGGGRSSAAIMGLVMNFDRLQSKTQAVAAGAGEFGAAWTRTQTNLNFQLAQLHASWDKIIIQLGTALIPVLVKVLAAIMPIVTKFSDWISKHSELIAKFAPLVIGVIALAGGLSILVGIVAFLASGFMALGSAIVVAATFMLANPISLIIVAIIALIAVIVLVITHWKQISKVVGEVWHNVTTFVSQAITNIWNAIRAWVANVFKTISDGLSSVYNSITDWVGSVWSTITGFFGRLLGAVETAWHAFTQRPIYWIGFLIGWLIGSYMRIVNNVNQFFTNLVTAGLKGAGDFVGAVLNWFGQLPGRLAVFTMQVLTNIVAWALQTRNAASKAGSDFINAVISFFQLLPGRVLSWLLGTLANIVSWAINARAQASKGASDVLNAITDELGKLPGQALNIGVQIVTGLWQGIQNMAGWLGDQVRSFASGIANGIKQALGISSPSKLFAQQVGFPIAQGIGLGITSGLPLVKHALLATVKPTTLAPSIVNNSTRSVGNMNFHINGAQDPLAVRDAVRRELVRQFGY